MQTRLTNLDFPNFVRNSVGFDHMFDRLLNSDIGKPGQSYPPYNIVKLSERMYAVEIAVAGFTDADIDITVENNVLTVKGLSSHYAAEEYVEPEYLFKGISNRSFDRVFNLAENVVVQDAKLENGLLRINLEHVVPEALKPKKISINTK